jgi:uncharacterized pyridoxal phosphate-dependent enzyme
MPDSLTTFFDRYLGGLSRRDLFRKGSLLTAPAWLRPGLAAPAATSQGLRVGPNIYESIGVRPIINCRGTFTIIGGSLELPEVRTAQDAAARHYVQLDELMDALGKRLAELTGAEWGMISAGCAAGLAHATAACVAGGNPDRHVRIPNLAGFPKDEVIIPKHSRNVYDAAVRSVGVRIVEAATAEEFEAALGPRVAMVYVLAGPNAETGPLPFETIARLAAQKKVPVLVDAAAEILTIPNVHLQRGAAIVAYSGGKCIRGPQCAGVLLGRKDLLQAAWVHSAPHHGYSRSMKLGKEEAMGMLMAVEMWVRRDHKGEWNQWMSWMNHIAGRVSSVEGVTTSISETKALSNQSPVLSIHWDTSKVGITGADVANTLMTTEPRITLNAGGGRRGGAGSTSETGVSITAYMMQPGEDKVVADRLHAVLSGAPKSLAAKQTQPPASDISGQWDVSIEFAAGTTNHALYLRQNSARIEGTHQGDFVSRDLTGAMEGDTVHMSSAYTEQHGDSLSFRFTGKVDGDSIAGDLDMGEYLKAKWTAKRHQFRRAGGPA